jgi:hypothetical protein
LILELPHHSILSLTIFKAKDELRAMAPFPYSRIAPMARAGWFVWIAWLTVFVGCESAWKSAKIPDPLNTQKIRLVVLTDIGGDPDDEQSLVRLLIYANDFNIEGLIAGAYTYNKDSPGVRTDLIEKAVRAYGQVRDNLLKHRKDYPTAEYLLGCIKRGNPDALSAEHASDDVWRSLGVGH